MYLRDDIYFCDCCAQFFDIKIDQPVDVPYSEMPAEFAVDLMQYRATLGNKQHKKKRKKRRSFIDL